MMMMKDVKDEGKQISPLFPRLHVNDREKGGPRAPPRNKMALYEQLSIPLQKFSSTSPSPSSSTSNHSPAPPMPSRTYQINLLTPASGSPVKYLSGKLEVTSLGIKLTPTQEKGNPKTAIISHLGTSSTHLSASQGNPTRLEGMQDDKVPVLRKQIREDDFAVLERMKLPPITHCARGNEKLSERKPCLNPGSSSQKQSCVDKKTEPVRPAENQCRENARGSESKGHGMHVESPVPRERPDPILSTRVASNASSSPSHGNSRCELLKRPHESVTLECRSHSSGVVVKLPRIKGPSPDNHSFRVNETSVRGEATSPAKSTLNSLLENKTNSNTREDDDMCNEAGNGDLQAAKRCQFPDTVVTESASAIGIMPDDVVGAIGEKLFWKTRRAIVDQQRVFGVQVFELHRLMKVQKLLSRSPELLEVCGLGTLKPPAEAIRTTEVPSERPLELPWKDQTSGNPQGKLLTAKIPLPPINSDIREDLFAKWPEQIAYPFCYPAAGNHWLVPVVSPSEGLVYKPYTGPCPPIGSEFMAPVYGGCGPIILGPTLGDSNATFGIPASHHQGIGVSHSYFPPISLPVPVMNPPDGRFSMGEANLSQFHPPSSHNVSTQVSKVVAVSQHRSKSQKLSEMQGSTGSSPVDPMNGGTSKLLLFPMEQASNKAAGETRSSDRPRGVIKVVPHNRKSASESVARIFRSIQEERGRRD